MKPIEEVLAKLRVKSGLTWGDPVPLGGPWKVTLLYDRERSQFAARLHFGERKSTMYLAKDDVETRGKSPWMTENTWRLSSAGITKVKASIEKIWSDPRYRSTD